MSSPFDTLAPAYHELWTDTPEGRSQRQRVWDVIEPLFLPGSRVLDLGCGIGDDALHLRQRGVTVDAIDASEQMVAIARSRGVAARLGSIESLTASTGFLSNFGALNCLTSLGPLASALASVLPPNAPAVLCVMGRFSLRETIHYLLRFDLARAARRWRGHAIWRDIPIRYWSAREIRRAFHPHFRLERRIPIGGGDHQLYILRKQAAGGEGFRGGAGFSLRSEPPC
jgi:SAM-dependent methyltransferase